MTVSNSTFTSLVQRYSHKDGKIYFDDYIHCIARLRTMFGKFCFFPILQLNYRINDVLPVIACKVLS